MAGSWRIGVCSWSLAPKDAETLADQALATGVTAVQLALDPIRLGMMGLETTRRRLGEAGLSLVSGMMAMEGEDYSTIGSIRETGGVAPDGTWDANRRAARELAGIAQELGITLVTFHSGHLPPAEEDPRWEVMASRLRELAQTFGNTGVRVALETGPETAPVLSRMLDALARDNVGVNFDPGNLILYGSGDPLPTLQHLAPRVAQIHIKDALPALQEGDWGTEVPVGRGAVDWAAVLGALRRSPDVTTLVIEREAGPDRVGDIAEARRFLASVIR